MMNSELELAAWTTDIVSAYVSNNAIAGEKLPEFIGSIYTALSTVSSQMVEQPKVELKPAVPVKKSLTPEYLICLEDGKKFKSLKRHLQAHYGLSPDEYRQKWGLPRDYPMVAPAYAAARSNLAKTMGLGRARRRKPSRGGNACRRQGAREAGQAGSQSRAEIVSGRLLFRKARHANRALPGRCRLDPV